MQVVTSAGTSSANPRPLYLFTVSEAKQKEFAAIRLRDIGGLEFVLAGGKPEEWAVKVGLSPKRGRSLVLDLAKLLHLRADKSDGVPYPGSYASLLGHIEAWRAKLQHNRSLLLR